jgi:Holliday junction resolvase RusA-like endonuclease|tara:strand:- start:1027 stop:1419 length:393 start_codon:yes stop_codon:yes gene_type:complete
MHNQKRTILFEVLGEPASKANSRQLVTIKNRPAFIKSKKAREYLKMFTSQCPKLSKLLEGDLKVEATIYYKTRRPDLDESVILDAMETLIYGNDRQVKEKHIKWGLDRENPRSTIKVSQISSVPDSTGSV